MTDTDFLTTCTFLSDAQRQALRDQDLDTAAAFKHVTIARLEGEPFKLTTGKASKLLDAAGVGQSAPTAITIQQAEPLSREARIDRALEAAHKDPAAVSDLVDLGISHAVLQADDKLDVRATRAMLVHVSAGGPLGETWAGQRIVELSKLAAPPIWCSPPNGRPLQAGVDERTGIPWGELGLGGLRLAHFGYLHGMFGGEPDKAVFAEMQDAKGRQRVIDRMSAMGVRAEDMDARVVYQTPKAPQPPPPPRVMRDGALAQQRPVPGGLVGSLADLLVAMFDGRELRQLARDHGGTSAAHALPEACSLASLAHELADVLRRQGLINRQLRDRLIVARPRRVADIDAVFSAAGIV